MIKLFLGMPGAGKTLAMQDLVYDSTKAGWPCFVIDNAFEWLPETLDGKTNIRWRGRPPFIVRAPEPDSPDLDSAVSEVLEKNGVLVCEKLDDWEPRMVADLVKQHGNAIYVDDEIDLFARYKDWDDNPLKDFIHRGRHMPNAENIPTEVHIYGAARRPQNLHTDLTSMASEVFTFRMQGMNTLKRIQAEGYVEPQLIEGLPKLPDLYFHKWEMGGKITQGILKGLK